MLKGITQEQFDFVKEQYPKVANLIELINSLSEQETKIFRMAMIRSMGLAKERDEAMEFLRGIPDNAMPSA